MIRGNQLLAGKLVLCGALLMFAVFSGYAINDVWEYQSYKEFFGDYQSIGIALLLMLIRTIAADRIKLLLIWILLVLGIASWAFYVGVLGQRGSEAVWMLGASWPFLYFGAFISLFMGWKRNNDSSE